MKKRVSGQGLHIKDERFYDVLQCADKTEVWFDITAPFGTMAKTFKPRPPKKEATKKEPPKGETPPPVKKKPGKDK
jgi:hypothetical protein